MLMPWLEPVLQHTLQSQNAHALLLRGPQGVGQFELALSLARAWLCEQPASNRLACGACASCHLVKVHAHPDLLVLLPEALQQTLGWTSAGDDESASKAKPSKEIKVDAVRGVVQFAQTTSARGRGKVVVLHPAERMNTISANTLLKTLEEPAGGARFLLSCAAPDALLPTLRSRCQSVVLGLPPTAQAVAWLTEHGVAQPQVLLAAAGGQPQLALEWSQQGIDAALWARLPELVRQGESAALTAWPLPRLVDAMQKLCHDATCVAAGAEPRYFSSDKLSAGANTKALMAWMRELNRIARHVEHPWNANLVLESLVQQGQRALSARAEVPRN
jgi:DNA polymerase III subunit delta'